MSTFVSKFHPELCQIPNFSPIIAYQYFKMGCIAYLPLQGNSDFPVHISIFYQTIDLPLFLSITAQNFMYHVQAGRGLSPIRDAVLNASPTTYFLVNIFAIQDQYITLEVSESVPTGVFEGYTINIQDPTGNTTLT